MSEADRARGATRIEEPTRAERSIARRAAEARATVPDLELSADVDMTSVDGGTARVLVACARALGEFPRANGTYRDGHFELHERVNIGVTIWSSDAQAVPTIFDAGTKSLEQIAQELERLEARALEGELTPPELRGATFVVSDFGPYGVARASAIVTPSHAATLATGAMRAVPTVRDGVIVPGVQMTMTLVCDHRILFGSDAARFLRRIADLIESP
jgi:pyruvate dehydrogenase E2 component (dihydrolipoamide acetyltransferase)